MSRRHPHTEVPARNRSLDWRTTAFVVAAIGCASVVTIGLVSGKRSSPLETDAVNRPNVLREGPYASSDTCRACHPQQYESWHQSFHRTMTQVARPETVLADFAGQTIDTGQSHPIQLERRDNEFWATFDDPDASGPVHRISRPIVMVTGSHEQQQYWYATGRGRLVSKLPDIYLIGEKQWIPRHDAFLRPPGYSASDTGAWNAVCIACHTTGGRPRIDAPFGSRPVSQLRFDSQVEEFGISCEACHGPAAAHVSLNRNPARRYALHLTGHQDSTVTDPRELSPTRSSEVCGQCHSVWEFYDLAGERRANSSGLPYRPGDEIRDTRFIAQPTMNLDSPTMKTILDDDPRFVIDSFWPDGMVRVSGREYNGLIESPCYKNAPDTEHTLTCFSCHTLHKTDNDRRSLKEWAETHQTSRPADDDNEACLQCHQTLRANLGAHTKHRSPSANNCYNCHMPYTSYGLLRALRSHQVSVPNALTPTVSGRPDACNLCHLDKTLQWTSEQLHTWFQTPMPSLTDDERNISASLLWLLKGDAGQRAIVAWAMSWPPALEASGRGWIAPFLAQLLDDPYDAVRLIAARSLRQLPGYGAFSYDFTSPANIRSDAVARAVRQWRDSMAQDQRRLPSALLTGPDTQVSLGAIQRLIKQRNDRPVALRE